MWRHSVSLRLMVLSIVWIGATLGAGGAVLNSHFSTHVEQAFDANLKRHVTRALAVIQVDQGEIVLSERPSDPPHLRPLSGWYWQIQVGDAVVERSRSLWDEVLDISIPIQPGETVGFFLHGPRNQNLRVLGEKFILPGLDQPVQIFFAGPEEIITTDVEEFREMLWASLTLLGLGLMVVVAAQVFLGLRPLKNMREKLVAIHDGEAQRMDGAFPSEVKPLVDDLNNLLAHNAQVIERARTHAGNLAHALKTPLAVLRNEADGLSGDQKMRVQEQLSLMNDLVTRHLSRARAAGGMGAPGARTDLRDVGLGLARTLERIYQDRNLTVTLTGLDGVSLAADCQDVEEMLGNVLDNACKWARSKVEMMVLDDGKGVVMCVDDDGPGIAEDQRADVLRRGQRLDEGTPGSGLGLSIVLELVELYHGSLELDHAPLGGLRVRLTLPSAANQG